VTVSFDLLGTLVGLGLVSNTATEQDCLDRPANQITIGPGLSTRCGGPCRSVSMRRCCPKVARRGAGALWFCKPPRTRGPHPAGYWAAS
jgi:hypothetical protein